MKKLERAASRASSSAISEPLFESPPPDKLNFVYLSFTFLGSGFLYPLFGIAAGVAYFEDVFSPILPNVRNF